MRKGFELKPPFEESTLSKAYMSWLISVYRLLSLSFKNLPFDGRSSGDDGGGGQFKVAELNLGE
jgi:hypothetical protein